MHLVSDIGYRIVTLVGSILVRSDDAVVCPPFKFLDVSILQVGRAKNKKRCSGILFQDCFCLYLFIQPTSLRLPQGLELLLAIPHLLLFIIVTSLGAVYLLQGFNSCQNNLSFLVT